MGKGLTNRWVLVFGVGLGALLMGAVVSGIRLPNPQTGQIEAIELENSPTIEALSLPRSERRAKLEALAETGTGIDRSRARYWLAVESIEAGNAGIALTYLENLEADYPLMAGYVRLQRGRAQQLAGNATEAANLWQSIASEFPDDAVAAEALYELGQSDSQYWNRALAEFPKHPRSGEIALKRLERDPNNFELLKRLSTHLYFQNITELLDRLVENHSSQLTPEDWETIAFGYWEKTIYGKAGKAYVKAPQTPLNLYRAARGLQLGGYKAEARQAYRQLIATFPEAKETGEGLLRLSRIVRAEDAIPLLDTVIAQFSDKAAEALLDRSKVLQQLNSPTSAQQARQSVLSQYSDSDAAAQIRWENALEQVKAGSSQRAWDWARQIVTENPESEYAPEAAFWVGKWAQKLNRPDDARTAFEYVLRRYPESYYAWRSASMLGWNVGDFTTVRWLMPEIADLSQRAVLPDGSEVTKELYALGFDRTAWMRWQVEFVDPVEPTVDAQYTDGILRQSVGDYIDSLFMLESLGWRDDAEELARYRELKSNPAYWYALYPFPFEASIEAWSKQRQLDPLLTVALIRQESRFMPGIRSSADAVGLMQVLPETGDWIAAKRDEPSPKNLTDPDDNIRLGTLYLDYTHEEYNNNTMLALASYNAGPGNVDDWLSRFSLSDPDIFVSQIPFPETKGYVSSVMGNYWNYLRLYNPEIQQQLERLGSIE
ncbi:MAG: transglycosylase SLT domain-containing protein [Cyanobacteria bacterium SID2]|nr:transglycosylase SLT domain-containing protein [Cyanobacteria bacterium SID2]MBP0002236.1 transglycosylase SLT domain-containing protein [Cyanobacteria bacterium SBC]